MTLKMFFPKYLPIYHVPMMFPCIYPHHVITWTLITPQVVLGDEWPHLVTRQAAETSVHVEIVTQLKFVITLLVREL